MTRHPSAGLALAVVLVLLSLWFAPKPAPDEWTRTHLLTHTFASGDVRWLIAHPRGSVECPVCWPGETGLDPKSPISQKGR
jgi:hypothetical protein